jgi:hypothetical protein
MLGERRPPNAALGGLKTPKGSILDFVFLMGAAVVL